MANRRFGGIEEAYVISETDLDLALKLFNEDHSNRAPIEIMAESLLKKGFLNDLVYGRYGTTNQHEYKSVLFRSTKIDCSDEKLREFKDLLDRKEINLDDLLTELTRQENSYSVTELIRHRGSQTEYEKLERELSRNGEQLKHYTGKEDLGLIGNGVYFEFFEPDKEIEINGNLLSLEDVAKEFLKDYARFFVLNQKGADEYDAVCKLEKRLKTLIDAGYERIIVDGIKSVDKHLLYSLLSNDPIQRSKDVFEFLELGANRFCNGKPIEHCNYMVGIKSTHKLRLHLLQYIEGIKKQKKEQLKKAKGRVSKQTTNREVEKYRQEEHDRHMSQKRSQGYKPEKQEKEQKLPFPYIEDLRNYEVVGLKTVSDSFFDLPPYQQDKVEELIQEKFRELIAKNENLDNILLNPNSYKEAYRFAFEYCGALIKLCEHKKNKGIEINYGNLLSAQIQKYAAAFFGDFKALPKKKDHVLNETLLLWQKGLKRARSGRYLNNNQMHYDNLTQVIEDETPVIAEVQAQDSKQDIDSALADFYKLRQAI